MGLDGFLALPIHPSVIHFPIAMLSAAWAFTLFGHATRSGRWRRLATDLEWIGLAFVPAALLTGLRDAQDLEFLFRPDFSQPLIWHSIASGLGVTAFLAHAVWRRRPGSVGRPWTDIAFVSVGFWLLLMTGLIAGEIVYG